MRSQFLLVPIAMVAAAPAAPSYATIYMSIEQAQKQMFPDASFTPNFVTIDQDQYDAIIQDAGVVPWGRALKAWRVSTGGWFVIDQVHGRDDWITYAVGIDQNGAVKSMEILECVEHYDGITNKAWRAQFYGKQRGTLKFDDIQIISGATLSSGQIAAGVKRLLSTVALVLSPPVG